MHKTKTLAEYQHRINKAIDFIIEHLDQPLSLEAIAAASRFSAYYFHRIFHAMVGETVNDYVQRKKMERAANKVSNFYMELYSAWLPNSGFEPDNYPPVAHYLNDSRQDVFVEMEVYIKVKMLESA